MEIQKLKKLKQILDITDDPTGKLLELTERVENDEIENSNDHQSIRDEISTKINEVEQSIQDIELIEPERGDRGDKGDKGDRGDKGDKGDKGDPGKGGKDGVDGKDGLDGKDGVEGKIGPQGTPGEKGDKPGHQWKGSKLRFERPDGSWGKYVDLQGKDGNSWSIVGKSAGSVTVQSDGIEVSQGVKYLNFADGLTATAITGDTVKVDFNGGEVPLSNYLYKPGVAGGQTAYGGVDAGDNLTLGSTAHATKGKIFFGADSVYDEVNIRLGLKTTSPTQRLEIYDGNISFDSVDAPGACTAALAGVAGNVDNGTHTYRVTFRNSAGETILGTASNTITVANKTVDGQVSLTGIPTGAAKDAITSRRIYRTKAGGTAYFLVATIANNTDTTYTDNIADSALTSINPENAYNRDNTINGKLYKDGFLYSRYGGNMSFGKQALQSLDGGFLNLAIGTASLYTLTSGAYNCCLGGSSGYYLTSGQHNMFIGTYCGYHATTAAYTVAVGNWALGGAVLTANGQIGIGSSTLRSNNGANTVGIGYLAGYYPANNVTNASTADVACTYLGAYSGNAGITALTGAVAIGYMSSVGANYNIALGGVGSYAAKVVIGGTVATEKLHIIGGNSLMEDNYGVLLGTGSDMKVYYDGTSGYIATNLVAASDLHVGCGTDKTVVLDETVWDDLRVVPGSFDRPGVSDPTIQAVQPGGSGTTTYLYRFEKNDIASFTIQLPHNYKVGTDIYAHVHWTPGDRGNEENGATVGWKIDYTWENIGGTFGTISTLDLSDACDGTDWKHQMTSNVAITGADKTISSMLICNIKRTDTGDDDTWVGTGTNSPFLLEIDFHYEIDTMGSRTTVTK